MKKTALIFFVAIVFCTHSHAQSQGSSTDAVSEISVLNTLADNANKVVALINSSKMEDATQLYKTVVVGMLHEIGATEQHKVNAKGTPQEAFYGDMMKKQNVLYGDVMALYGDLAGDKGKLVEYVDQFIDVTKGKH